MLPFVLQILSSFFISQASARDIPSNIQSFLSSVQAQGDCTNKLATGFFSSDDGPNTFSYCGDHLSDFNVIYIQGPGGQLTNMDIDCDGIQGSPADDGRCGSSGDTQSTTSFADTVAGFDKGITDLDANIHPYVVFGNVGNKAGFIEFNPEEFGVQPLSVMAVVCGNQLIYGVWGDENGDDGDHPLVGEASISLATACFGNGVNGNSGHDANDVLYLAFPGADAVPGADGANWAATSFDDFESSISGLGDQLIQRIGGGNS